MKRSFLFSAICLLLSGGKAAAGWYHVENYEGLAGPEPIHLSIQRYDGFGSGITIEGSYYMDAKRSPVAIYGTAKGSKLTLCEISSAKQFHRVIVMGSKKPVDTSRCRLSLTLDESGAAGEWIKNSTKYPVTLRKVAALDDIGDGKIDGTVEIPFWAQTRSYMFLGIYANAGSGICMQKLQVINKSSKDVAQEIVLADNNCGAGMLMTPIYMNVEKDQTKGVEGIGVNFRDGGAGYTINYVFNRKTKRFQQKK